MNDCIGWREWLVLPELGLKAIKAKVDTGARTSAIHAFQVDPFMRDGALWVRFGVHPIQHDSRTEHWCEAPVIDERQVSDSGGHKELRYVIESPLLLNGQLWPIEITLTNRDSMLFRMLLGRTALKTLGLRVDPGRSYRLGKPEDTDYV